MPTDSLLQIRDFQQSQVVRKAFEREVRALDVMDEFLSKSDLTEADAERIGHKLKLEIRKRF